MERRPTAFVSYAQSSREWQELVLDFTVALRSPGGVDAEVDLFHDVDHQRWATFGANLIEASDFTLIAVDGAYKRRWLGKEERGVGAGVAREAAAIRAIYDRDQNEFLRRIKLVLLPEIGEEDVPGDLLGDCERFVIGSFDLDGLDRLLRSIYGKAAHPKPDLAPIPVLPPKAIARLEGRNSSGEAAGPAGAKAADTRDKRNLRGQLRRVRGELREVGASEARKDTLRREQTALEVSLEALAQAQRPRRPKARKRASRRSPAAESGRALWWGSLLIALVAAVAGTALAASALSRSPESLPRPFTARSSGVELQGPPGWRQQAGRAGISSLGISAPVNLTPGLAQQGDAPGRLAAVAGISQAAGAKLLSATYREQLGEGTEKTPVDLGSLEAYRYAGLETASGDPLTMYVVPTSIGVATLACRMPEEEDAGIGSRLCSRIASTLRLTSGEAYPLGPSAAFAKAIRRQFKRLQRRQGKALQSMSKARRAEAQGTAADKLADVYRDAARALTSIQITPESEGGRTMMVAALRRVRDAYKRLAVAARHEDEPAYVEAKQAVAAGERLMRQRLGQLRSMGYQVT